MGLHNTSVDDKTLFGNPNWHGRKLAPHYVVQVYQASYFCYAALCRYAVRLPTIECAKWGFADRISVLGSIMQNCPATSESQYCTALLLDLLSVLLLGHVPPNVRCVLVLAASDSNRG